MKKSEKKVGQIVMNIIKWIALIYLAVFVPSILLGVKVGVAITFGVVCLWLTYEASERYHKKREEHLKNLLRNDGGSEEVINHGLEEIDKEQGNR